MRRLHVACAIDDDIIALVRNRRVTSTRTRYDVSLVDALVRYCRKVDLVGAVDNSLQTLDEIARVGADVVFNLAFGAMPVEASFAGGLQLLGVPYTGSGPSGIALSRDKIRSRQILAEAGFRVPRWVELERDADVSVDLPPPLIVKPATLAASVGIYNDSVLRKRTGVARLAERIWDRFGVSALCEEFIVGRELRVGLVETATGDFRVSGISEWDFGACEPGWGYKTEAIRINPKVRKRHKITRASAELPRPLLRRVAETTAAAARALGLHGYAAADLRIDSSGELVLLEVNANPGLWAGGSVWARPSFNRNLGDILRAAFREKQ